jgi:hypothetical protein
MVWHKVDAWTGPRIVIEREDRGRHTHRGSHSSSHDSRRIDAMFV